MYSHTNKSTVIFCVAALLLLTLPARAQTEQAPAQKPVKKEIAKPKDPVKARDASAAKKPTPPAPTPLTTPTNDDKEAASCKRLFLKYAIPYQQLWAKRGPELRDEHTDGLSLIADMTPEHCSEPQTRKDALALLSRLLNQHSGKVAVLLPLSTKPYTNQIIHGMEIFLRNASVDPTKIILSRDTQSKTPRMEQILAQAVFQDQVSAVIGAYDSSDISVLSEWATRLMIPTFILNKAPTDHKPKPFVYFSHPTQKGLAKALVAANVRYRHKKISIMRPNDQHADELVREYEALAKPAGITILHNVVYDAKRIDQMESAARKLFQIEPNDRLEDLKKLYANAKQHAAKTGTTFNPKMVALQPVVEQDAIMIVDQFRNVRHMSKVFSFLGVRRLPLFGHHEWRSLGLIEPFDPMFIGSYFVDFVGSYASLPNGIKVTTSVSPYLIPPDKVEEIDLTLLGYRAMETPFNLAKAKETIRRKMEGLIPRVDTSSPKSIEFDGDNVISWPTYLFEVGSQGSSGSIIMRGNL